MVKRIILSKKSIFALVMAFMISTGVYAMTNTISIKTANFGFTKSASSETNSCNYIYLYIKANGGGDLAYKEKYTHTGKNSYLYVSCSYTGLRSADYAYSYSRDAAGKDLRNKIYY